MICVALILCALIVDITRSNTINRQDHYDKSIAIKDPSDVEILSNATRNIRSPALGMAIGVIAAGTIAQVANYFISKKLKENKENKSTEHKPGKSAIQKNDNTLKNNMVKNKR
ncbi:hypothetical protein GJ496_012057 [Pomphorhynchus laevis]|nr:hypothetical protein GJ496_012057 [Pomphorhynchus laevis]